jgi:uncharacterized protein (TIGR00299 family) protein
MATLYLDLFSGISGDMFIGALLDLGVEFRQLESELRKLGLGGYHLHAARRHKSSIEGVKFDVHLDEEHGHGHSHEHEHAEGAHHHGHAHAHAPGHGHSHSHSEERNYRQIRELITQSALSDWVKTRALAVFRRLAEAEGKIHGLPVEQVHFHEVGAVDSIVDVVGGCIGLELLGKPRLLCSGVVDGNGWVDCAHGRFPIPAPATLAILGARGVPLSQCSEPNELVTPTGAALIAELAESFGPMQGLVARKVGFGLGTRENKTRANVLRAVLGEVAAAAESAHDWETDTVAVLETNLDDLSPEVLGHFVDKALAAGALDVFYTPIQMKKNRPGTLLTVLCAEGEADRFCAMILKETSAFGVRRHVAERRKLAREFVNVTTPHGPVTIKLGRLDGRVVQAAPEYESCKQAAANSGAPLKEVYEAAIRAWRES